MALRLVELLFDRTAAEASQLMIEYDPQPPFDAGALDKVGEGVVERVVEYAVGPQVTPSPALCSDVGDDGVASDLCSCARRGVGGNTGAVVPRRRAHDRRVAARRQLASLSGTTFVLPPTAAMSTIASTSHVVLERRSSAIRRRDVSRLAHVGWPAAP